MNGGGAFYEVQVAGCMGEDWSDWFDAQVVMCERENKITIRAWLPDQAALFGLLAKVRDLGLLLLSVDRRTE